MTRDEAIQLAGYHYLSDRPRQAEEVLLRQLRETPEDPLVLYNLALLSEQDGRTDACTEYCERSLKQSEDFYAAADLLARQRLRDGNWKEGFSLFEARFKKERGLPYLHVDRPSWGGESLQGRSLLVWFEQGLGDTVQFSCLLPRLRKRGCRVVLLVQDELADILRESGLADKVYAQSEVFRDGVDTVTRLLEEEDIAFHIPIMSLGRVLELDPYRLGLEDSFLQVSPDRSRWAADLVKEYGESRGPRVGLVWSGSTDGPAEIRKVAAQRNVFLDALRPVLEIEGVHFFSFQKGIPGIEALEFPSIARLPLDGSFANTAALLLQMDLLITVDTSICHVGAGLGLPVWMLNRYNGCWRWGRDSKRIQWSPSLRIFQQTRIGEWEPVVAEVARELSLFEISK